MCWFLLHVSDFKKIKNLLQFFLKKNLLCKKREKNNLSGGKIPAPPPGYQMVCPLQPNKHHYILNHNFLPCAKAEIFVLTVYIIVNGEKWTLTLI